MNTHNNGQSWAINNPQVSVNSKEVVHTCHLVLSFDACIHYTNNKYYLFVGKPTLIYGDVHI